MTIKQWLSEKDETRFDRYLVIIITSVFTFLFALLLNEMVKDVPCVQCLKCSMINSRTAILQNEINNLQTKIYAFKEFNKDSVEIFEKEIIAYSIRIEEMHNIIDQLSKK